MIKRELIYLDQEYSGREQVLRKLCQDGYEFGVISNADIFMEAVMERERDLPTSIGFNVSIPHGKSEFVREPFISFMRTKMPFIWDQKNNENTKLIFLIGVPMEQKNTLHLKILANISKKLLNEEFRDILDESSSKEIIYKLLKSIEEETTKGGENK